MTPGLLDLSAPCSPPAHSSHGSDARITPPCCGHIARRQPNPDRFSRCPQAFQDFFTNVWPSMPWRTTCQLAWSVNLEQNASCRPLGRTSLRSPMV
jgi:hypothetical protein